jgi:hypothetical protein
VTGKYFWRPSTTRSSSPVGTVVLTHAPPP